MQQLNVLFAIFRFSSKFINNVPEIGQKFINDPVLPPNSSRPSSRQSTNGPHNAIEMAFADLVYLLATRHRTIESQNFTVGQRRVTFHCGSVGLCQ